MTEYRVDELARAAGMTTRNVRAYQDRGLLPAPRRDGRVAIYGDAHLARLRLIGSLLDRGYTFAQISELLSAWEQGKNLGEVLGLEEAVGSPWTSELPTYWSTDEVRELLPGEAFDRVERLGLIQHEGEQCLVHNPQLLNVWAQLLQYGFGASEVVDLYERIAPPINEVARQLVEAGASRLIAEHGAAWLPEGAEVTEVTAMLQHLRQLTMSSVQGILAHAMERNVQDVLGEHLTRVLSQES